MMSNKLNDVGEKKLRGWIRQILAENKEDPSVLLTEEWDDSWGPSVDSNDFMNVFVTPFTDVLKTAAVAALDIASVAKLNLDFLLTFGNTEKAEMALNRYNDRKAKIDQRYEEVMKTTNEVLEGGDASILLFSMSPGAYLAAKSPKALKDTQKFLNDAGFETLGGRLLPKTRKEKGEEGEERGPIKQALSDLSKIFFLAHHDITGDVLQEAEEGDDVKQKSTNAVGTINDHLEQTGVMTKLTAIRKELLDAKKEHIEELMPVVEGFGQIITALADANTLEDFIKAAEQSQGVVEDVGQLEGTVQKEAEKILKNPEARESIVKTMAEKEGIKPEKDPKTGEEKLPEIEDEKLMPDVRTLVFTNMKSELQQQLQDAQTQFKEDAMAQLNDENLTDTDLKMLEASPEGKEYASLLRGAATKINEA
jgi:hypothetical protein